MCVCVCVWVCVCAGACACLSVRTSVCVKISVGVGALENNYISVCDLPLLISTTEASADSMDLGFALLTIPVAPHIIRIHYLVESSHVPHHT